MTKKIPYFEICPKCGAAYPKYRQIDNLQGDTPFTAGYEYLCDACGKHTILRNKTAATKACKALNLKPTAIRNGKTYQAIDMLRMETGRAQKWAKGYGDAYDGFARHIPGTSNAHLIYLRRK